MRVVVTHLTGSLKGQRNFYDVPRLSIGRARESTIRLGIYDTHASSRHAELYHENGRYILVDVGSTNGTYINGKRVEQVRLRGGEAVTFGYEGPQLCFEFFDTMPTERPSLDEPHEFPFKARFAWLLFGSSVLLLGMAVALFLYEYIVFAIPVGLLAAIIFFIGLAAVRINITIGPEGIEQEWMFGTRRLRWEEIASLETRTSGTGLLKTARCTVIGWKSRIVFSPRDYSDGHLLARLIAEASGNEWRSPGARVSAVPADGAGIAPGGDRQ